MVALAQLLEAGDAGEEERAANTVGASVDCWVARTIRGTH